MSHACGKPKRGPTRKDVMGDPLNVNPTVLRRHLRSLKRPIRQFGVEFDAIAFCGYSGVMVALTFNKPTILIRKAKEPTHSYFSVIGPTPGKHPIRKYIIVDDVVDTGSTVRYIREKVKEKYPKVECVGVFLYPF